MGNGKSEEDLAAKKELLESFDRLCASGPRKPLTPEELEREREIAKNPTGLLLLDGDEEPRSGKEEEEEEEKEEKKPRIYSEEERRQYQKRIDEIVKEFLKKNPEFLSFQAVPSECNEDIGYMVSWLERMLRELKEREAAERLQLYKEHIYETQERLGFKNVFDIPLDYGGNDGNDIEKLYEYQRLLEEMLVKWLNKREEERREEERLKKAKGEESEEPGGGDPKPPRPLGRYALQRWDFIKNYMKDFYNSLLEAGELWDHLESVQKEAAETVERIVAKNPPPDNEKNPVGYNNMTRLQAEEWVVREVVFCSYGSELDEYDYGDDDEPYEPLYLFEQPPEPHDPCEDEPGYCVDTEKLPDNFWETYHAAMKRPRHIP